MALRRLEEIASGDTVMLMERIHGVSLLRAQGLRYRDGGRWQLTTFVS